MFKKYQHLERLGSTEVLGIEDGECYIFPKIDGTNSSLWWDNGLKAGSRNRELSLESDNAGFYAWALGDKKIAEFFQDYPDLRLYGEWLVPHTLKTYSETAWRKFYVFDVMNGDEYMSYDTYSYLLKQYDIEFIPPLFMIKNPNSERLIRMLESNTYLIKDGCGVGEGIVIKNYKFVNKYGRVVWAKIVRNEFKSEHSKVQVTEVKEVEYIEDKIVSKYVTMALVEKEYSKISIDGWNSKNIPQLFSTVFYCLVREECWSFIKEFKNPVIDFKRLNNSVIKRIKELKPELF